MSPDHLDKMLLAMAEEDLPPCPGHLTSAIWKDIDHRRGRSFWSRLHPILDWRELFAEPRLTLPALGIALAMGLVPALFLAAPDASVRLARQSFHFEVFSSESSMAMLNAPASNSPQARQ